MDKQTLNVWLGFIAIIIMLLGCYLVIQETKACKNPYRDMIDKYLAEDLKLNYSYAVITVYNTPYDMVPLATLDLIGEREIEVYGFDKNLSVNVSNYLIK